MKSRDAVLRQVSRRGFLGGVGGCVLSLPYLESLAWAAPAGSPVARAAGKPATRLAVFYLPNSLVRRGFFPGESERPLPKFANQNNVWRFEGKAAPVGVHPLTLTETMKPLDDLRDKVTLITGMDRTFQHGTDSHAQAGSCYLTSLAPYTNRDSPYPIGRTLDHVVADHIGKDTPFATLELSCNDSKDNRESIYFDNMSWYGPGHVAPSLRDPRKVYDRLFRTEGNTRSRNITDLIMGGAKQMQRRLSTADREKFGEYLASVRSIEQRMERIEAIKGQLAKHRVPRPEAQLPRNRYVEVMGDLMLTAMRVGLTNVSTLMIGSERWPTPVNYEGILDEPRNHHGMTHNQNKFEADLLKLDRFHVGAFANLIRKMAAIEEPGGTTMLDNMIITLGAGLGDGATHQYNDLPVIVAGGGGGKLKHGRHIQVKKQTPLANLWLTQMHALGIKRDRYADSTGLLPSILTS